MAAPRRDVKAPNLSRKRLAERMHTSGSQVGRLLDRANGNVTLKILQRAAAMVGWRLRPELVEGLPKSHSPGDCGFHKPRTSFYDRLTAGCRRHPTHGSIPARVAGGRP
jgi:hypothetical protein